MDPVLLGIDPNTHGRVGGILDGIVDSVKYRYTWVVAFYIYTGLNSIISKKVEFP